MKTYFSILIYICLASSMYAQNIIRVNNNTNADADYTDLQIAITNANAGDTIYVEGSSAPYSANGTIYIDKQLTIIGPGYYLSEQDSTYQNRRPATISSISFNGTSPYPGSGTKLIGLKITNSVTIYGSNISLEKCLIHHITMNSGSSNTSIIHCNITGNIYEGYNGLTYSNLIIRNSIIHQVYDMPCFSNCLLANNTFTDDVIDIDNTVLENNIFLGTVYNTASNYNNQFDNNVFVNYPTNLPITANANISATLASLFVGGTGSDEQYQLSATSPAKGAGLSGVDCGAFGGSTPYILSGVPNLPHIFKIITGYGPNVNQMNVNVKATTNN